MKQITALAGAVAFSLLSATSAGAVEAGPTMELLAHRIAVVNDFDAPIVVYAEAADGELHEVMTLKRGEVKLVHAEVEGTETTGLRLHVRPTNSADRWSTWGDRGIVTAPLRISADETAVFWVAADLGESVVEIRAS